MAITLSGTDGISFGGASINDYEEGTWTPSVNGCGTISYGGNRYGNYIRVGKVLHLWCRISGTPSGGSSSITITGFPFAFAQSQVAGSIEMYLGLQLSASKPVAGLWCTNTTSLALYQSGPAAGWDVVTGTMQGTTYFDIILNAVVRL